MSYQYLENIQLNKAIELYLKEIGQCGPELVSESIRVQDSLGRVTSEVVYARISSPHYNACAMDGIAVCARDTFGATETTPVTLTEGENFVRIDTGDLMPEGYDAVVMIEDVVEAGNGSIKLYSACTPWQHVRQIGEDICASEMIAASNTRIEPAVIGAFLAGGVLEVKVWKKPVVGIIPTGDEIVSPTAKPQEGEIIEFNSSVFSAMLVEWGAQPRVYDIVPDNHNRISQAVKTAVNECDMVLLNAGSSAGREDYSAGVISGLGSVLVHGIAIRPGKPTILGIIERKPVIGVPGYPVSGIIVMEEIVKKVLALYTKIDYPARESVKASISMKAVSSLKYEEFVRVKLAHVDNRLVATPLNRGAGVVTSFMKADGIMRIPHNSEGYESGQEVEVCLTRQMGEIRNTVVVIGSHDPLIDVVSDMIKRKSGRVCLSSVHVGSINGIMAVKRNKAHIAGIHLLDETTGEYNTSYIRKYFKNEKIVLIKCAKRIQGLMVSPGNPKNISCLKDLSKAGVRYVNRQKGAGTRILLDYMLKKDNINPTDIYGYEREEFTHNAVGTLIASGSADTGLGIYTVAKIYGLDFIPVCEEQYDFVIPERFLNLNSVKSFIEILKSVEFKTVLEEMGGYTLENPGEINRIPIII